MVTEGEGMHAQITAPDARSIRFLDICAQNRKDGFRVVAPVIQPDDVALRGRYSSLELRSGLRLHATDTVDMFDMVTQARAEPGLTLGVFLAGSARISLGSRPITLSGAGGNPHAFALYTGEQDLFERRGLRGQRVRKVNVNIPQGWLEAEDWPAVRSLAALCGDHRALRTWVPTARQLDLAARMIDPTPGMPYLDSLHREVLALEFVSDVLRAWLEEEDRPVTVSSRDRQRLRRACDCIDAHQDARLSVDQVARAAGMSVSALQRLFHAAYGTSVLDFARVRRLEQARRALEGGDLSVTEAALNAGYGSPANFATAFKRHFGVSPKDVRSRA